MSVGFTLNIIIALLLIITIFYCIRLSKRIANFNSSKTELSKFLDEFNKSILRAEKNIVELKNLGNNVDDNIQTQIKKARFLANDLSFLAEKAENVAVTLENKINMSRDIYRKVAADSIITQSTAQGKVGVKGEEVFRARNQSGVDYQSGSKPNPNASKKGALDNLLRQIAQKKTEINS
jgi:hypothetical protein